MPEKTYRRLRPDGKPLRDAGADQGKRARELDPLNRRYQSLLTSGRGEVVCYSDGVSRRFVLRVDNESWLMGCVRLINESELRQDGFVLVTFDIDEKEPEEFVDES